MGIKSNNSAAPFFNVFGASGHDAGNPPHPGGYRATGGTMSEPGNGYIYHLFTSSTPAPESSLVGTSGNPAIAQVLVVAGGGGAGFNYGGGGGGGGVAYATSVTLTLGTTYPVSVGSGGAAGVPSPEPSGNMRGTPGNNSVWNVPAPATGGKITALGGGGGGDISSGNGENGGSGGGDGTGQSGGSGTQPGQTNPPATTNYGNDGADAVPGAYASAGGGGAGGAGQDPQPSGTTNPDTSGGMGGHGQPFPGFEYTLVGMPTAPAFVDYSNSPTSNHYGAGGSGWGYGDGPNPPRSQGPDGGYMLAGYGGGGRGGYFSPGTGGQSQGVDNLGGGGGAAYPDNGQPGGDGVVIVRYPY